MCCFASSSYLSWLHLTPLKIPHQEDEDCFNQGLIYNNIWWIWEVDEYQIVFGLSLVISSHKTAVDMTLSIGGNELPPIYISYTDLKALNYQF